MKKPLSEVNYGLEVRFTLREFTRVLAAVAAPFDLTPAEFRLLRTLGDGKPRTQVELATLTALDRPYVTALVKKLIARGILRTSVSQEDRRRSNIALTKAGTLVCQQLSRELAKINRKAVDNVDEEKLQNFLEVSRAIRTNLEKHFPLPL